MGCGRSVPAEQVHTEEKIELEYDNNAFEDTLIVMMCEINNNSSNIVFSPFSIHTAMTICMLGAANNTLKEIRDILYPNVSYGALTFGNSKKLMDHVIEHCIYYNTTYNGQDGNPLIKVANKIWINQEWRGIKLLSKYKKACPADYMGRFHRQKSEEAARKINSWCAEQTADCIKGIVLAGDLIDAQLVITNAIYFNGKFGVPFHKNYTRRNTPFYASKSKKEEICKVSMMQNEYWYSWASGVNDVYDVVCLPYKFDKKLSLILAINKHSDEVNPKLLTTTDIINIEWTKEKMKLFVPKFKYEYKINMDKGDNILQHMGIRDAFIEGKADFSNMDKDAIEEKLHIGRVIHKAMIEVDEAGTEAAAVSMIGVDRGKGCSARKIVIPPTLRFDHPFQFFIFDEEKEIALFCGIFTGGTNGKKTRI